MPSRAKQSILFSCALWFHGQKGDTGLKTPDTYFPLSVAAVFAALLFAPVAFAQTAPAAGSDAKLEVTEIKDFKDWRMKCLSDGAQEACSIFQNNVAKAKNSDEKIFALLARMMMVERDGTTTPHLSLVAPLGVWLPGGISFQFDDGKTITAPFLQCGPDGCITDLAVSDDFLPTIKKSRTMHVTYALPNQQPITVDVSMMGITAGLNALSARQ